MATNFAFLKDETEEILDEIRKASKFGYSEKASIVDNLLKKSWCRESDLLFAYNDFQESEGARVTALFHLPFPIKLPEYTWIKVRSEFGHPYLACSSLNSEFNPSENPNLGQTQVFISFQLWNTRADFYPLYLQGLESGQKNIRTNLRSSGVWSLEEFEDNLANRLRLQSREVLKEFIPLYKIVCKETKVFAPEKLQCFFIMAKNARLVCRNLAEEAKANEESQVVSEAEVQNNLTALKRRLKTHLPPSIYELYFLEVCRLIETGNFDLAVVQTIVILDWFANEIIESHLISNIKKSLASNTLLYKLTYESLWETKKNTKIKVKTIEKFSKYFPALGIKLHPDLLKRLRQINKLRNEIVHRYKTNFIGEEAARDALEMGMEIVHFSMKYIVANHKKIK